MQKEFRRGVVLIRSIDSLLLCTNFYSRPACCVDARGIRAFSVLAWMELRLQSLALKPDRAAFCWPVMAFLQRHLRQQKHARHIPGKPLTNLQSRMLSCTLQVNVDSNTVGWYQTTHLGQPSGQQQLQAAPQNDYIYIYRDIHTRIHIYIYVY